MPINSKRLVHLENARLGICNRDSISSDKYTTLPTYYGMTKNEMLSHRLKYAHKSKRYVNIMATNTIVPPRNKFV